MRGFGRLCDRLISTHQRHSRCDSSTARKQSSGRLSLLHELINWNEEPGRSKDSRPTGYPTGTLQPFHRPSFEPMRARHLSRQTDSRHRRQGQRAGRSILRVASQDVAPPPSLVLPAEQAKQPTSGKLRVSVALNGSERVDRWRDALAPREVDDFARRFSFNGDDRICLNAVTPAPAKKVRRLALCASIPRSCLETQACRSWFISYVFQKQTLVIGRSGPRCLAVTVQPFAVL